MNKYRENTTWDSVHWGTHCVDCYPGGCPMRVYVKDGVIVREEPSGTLPVIDPAVPDFNPQLAPKVSIPHCRTSLLHPQTRCQVRLQVTV